MNSFELGETVQVETWAGLNVEKDSRETPDQTLTTRKQGWRGHSPREPEATTAQPLHQEEVRQEERQPREEAMEHKARCRRMRGNSPCSEGSGSGSPAVWFGGTRRERPAKTLADALGIVLPGRCRIRIQAEDCQQARHRGRLHMLLAEEPAGWS